MPALTPTDPTVLPRIPRPDPAVARFRSVQHLITAPRQLEGAGFEVRRPFPGIDLTLADPFLLLDHLGAVEYAPGEAKGAPWHPHRGFETVTYLLDGAIQHTDSNGGGGVITDGATQWMTAGAGILHDELPTERLVRSGGLFHGVQLWVNLPAHLQVVAAAVSGHRPGPGRGSSPRTTAGPSSASSPASWRAFMGRASPRRRSPTATPRSARGPGWRMPWRADFNALAYVLAGQGVGGPGRPADPRGAARRVRPWRRPDAGRRPTIRTPLAVPGGVAPGRRADPAAHRLVRAVRDEHQGRDHPGFRGLPGRQDGRDPGNQPGLLGQRQKKSSWSQGIALPGEAVPRAQRPRGRGSLLLVA